MPTLGVVLTNYNHGSVIEHALSALTFQDHRADQLIIVDDGSTDSSLEAIRPFLDDERVVLVKHDVNRGLAAAIRSGLEKLSCDYVYFAAANDFVLPGFFKKAMSAALDHPDVAMIYGRLVDRGGGELAPEVSGLQRDVHGWLLDTKEFFERYFRPLGSLANLSPATIYKVTALDEIKYQDLLEEFDFVLESFVIQLLGGRYKSLYLDVGSSVWIQNENGGSNKFFKDPARVKNFVDKVVGAVRRDPYSSSFSDEHFGLYLFGLWFRAIAVGYDFKPLDIRSFKVVDIFATKNDGLIELSLHTRASDERPALADVQYGLIAAHKTLLQTQAMIVANNPSASSFKKFFWFLLIVLPRITLALSFRAHQKLSAIKRYLRRNEGSFGPAELISSASGLVPLRKPVVHRAREQKTLSALICNYNHAAYIRTAIEAVLNQDRRPDELLIMDDGSTDGSFEIMKEYSDRYDWVRVFKKEKNGGYISGISELTAIARGDFVHRGASDDYMLPNFVSSTMEQAEYFPDVGIVSGEMMNRREGSLGLDHIQIDGWETGFKDANVYRRYIESSDPRCTLAPSSIFRRSVVSELGGWREDLDIWDVSFVLHAAALKYGMAYVDDPVYSWVSRPRGWTEMTNKNQSKMIAMCYRYYQLMISPEFAPLFGDRYPYLWVAGNLGPAS